MPSCQLLSPPTRKKAFRSPGKGAPETVLFAFDLDGTVTAREMLPVIAGLSEHAEAVALLTRLTLSGRIAFEASFRTRFSLLKGIPLHKVREAVAAVPLDPHIEAFIRRRRGQCALVTGNLDLWIAPLVKRLGCRCFSSRGLMTPHGLELLSVLDKGRAVDMLQREGRKVIAVGESVNDIPMLRNAAVGVAFAGVHRPVPEIRRLAHYQAESGKDLCVLLEALAKPYGTKTPRQTAAPETSGGIRELLP